MNDKKTERYNIFLVTQLGIESITAKELSIKFPHLKDYEVCTGGIIINSIELQCCINLQHRMRTTTRILLRLYETKVRDLPKLFNKCKKIPWNKYFIGSIPKINIKSKNSRLFDDRKIESTISKAIKEYQDANAVKKKVLETYKDHKCELYVRIENDEATFSLDLTGKRMDLRSDKPFTDKAPLRSTIASAMICACIDNLEDIKYIHCPMAGSGTLTKEFQNFFLPIEREFSYMSSPLFESLSYSNLGMHKDMMSKYNFTSSDIDQASIEAMKSNFVKGEIVKEDFYNLKSLHRETILMINPPYNKRIKYETSSQKFIKKFTEQIMNLSPQIVCIIHPHKFKAKGYKARDIGPINNGGIKTYITILSGHNRQG